MQKPTALEGALLILRKLDEMDQRLMRMEEGFAALLPLFERLMTTLTVAPKAPEIRAASFADLYGEVAERGENLRSHLLPDSHLNQEYHVPPDR